MTSRDLAFLDDLSRRAFLYFDEQTDPDTGLTRDRARTDGAFHRRDRRHAASIAATGFGLTAWCIAAERKWKSRALAEYRVLAALRHLYLEAPRVRGWFYHFVDVRDGQRIWRSEISSIDTALLMAGALTAGLYFGGEARRLADALYGEVDFDWMLNGGNQLSHGWRPERGFLPYRWDNYSEHLVLNLLALGSPRHAVPAATWNGFARNKFTYGRSTYLGDAPLFTHQYSHAWVDFRNRRDNFGNYFTNSKIATVAHRQFCLDLRGEFPGYDENTWGITASDSVKGYVDWGGPPRHKAVDGSVVPCAAAGSLMFTPEICLPALLHMKERFGERIWDRYGFTDAFHPLNGWTNRDVVGIDVGITLLAAENLRSGFVWKWFMKHPAVLRGMTAARLREL